ncbi:hypothetical protein D3C78_1932210 [compost metagenome]
MPDAMDEERILLANDLGGDLHDRFGALIETAGEPVGGLQAFVEKGLVGAVLFGAA